MYLWDLCMVYNVHEGYVCGLMKAYGMFNILHRRGRFHPALFNREFNVQCSKCPNL